MPESISCILWCSTRMTVRHEFREHRWMMTLLCVCSHKRSRTGSAFSLLCDAISICASLTPCIKTRLIRVPDLCILRSPLLCAVQNKLNAIRTGNKLRVDEFCIFWHHKRRGAVLFVAYWLYFRFLSKEQKSVLEKRLSHWKRKTGLNWVHTFIIWKYGAVGHIGTEGRDLL